MAFCPFATLVLVSLLWGNSRVSGFFPDGLSAAFVIGIHLLRVAEWGAKVTRSQSWAKCQQPKITSSFHCWLLKNQSVPLKMCWMLPSLTITYMALLMSDTILLFKKEKGCRTLAVALECVLTCWRLKCCVWSELLLFYRGGETLIWEAMNMLFCLFWLFCWETSGGGYLRVYLLITSTQKSNLWNVINNEIWSISKTIRCISWSGA